MLYNYFITFNENAQQLGFEHLLIKDMDSHGQENDSFNIIYI